MSWRHFRVWSSPARYGALLYLVPGITSRSGRPKRYSLYLRIVLRSTPKLAAISFCDRPACQCTRISVISTTSKLLLAIGSPFRRNQTGRHSQIPDGQVHHDTHPIPMRNYVIALGNYMIVKPSPLRNYVTVDTL